MCCHRRIIYNTCGHSTFSPTPLMECRHASIDPTLQWSTTCEIVAHPYKSLRIDQLCPACEARRENLLRTIEESQSVRFDEWRWKVSYGMQDMKDEYWDRKAKEAREGVAKDKEKKRFSWRRKKRESGKRDTTRNSEGDGDGWKTPKTPRTPNTPRIAE